MFILLISELNVWFFHILNLCYCISRPDGPLPKKTSGNVESMKREEGLQKSLDSSNKGFSLMAKMGYKAGDGLGTIWMLRNQKCFD